MEYTMEKPTVSVNMLGTFSITIGDISITDYNNQAKKPWELLEYLITFRNREIPPGELVDLFWSNDTSANPGSALKTLLFRSRKLLSAFPYPPQEMIVQQRGTYAWNKDFHIVTDADKFEELCGKANDGRLSEDNRLSFCLQALELYKGDFLPKSAWESWVVPLSTFYHSLYLDTAHKALKLLINREDYSTAIDICQKAITIEQFDEDFHYTLILALFNSGDQHQAMEHYSRTVDMFYNEFAITPSDRLRMLYKLIRDKKHGIIEDLTVIQESLMEDAPDNDGAFYCEPSVFKDIYQIESRAIKRTGDSIYLCLLTISDLNGKLLKPAILSRSMEELNQAIRNSLRRGDVYTRYSISQYILLLPTASYENGEMVLQRIIHHLKENYSRRDLMVNYSLQPVFPN